MTRLHRFYPGEVVRIVSHSRTDRSDGAYCSSEGVVMAVRAIPEPPGVLYCVEEIRKPLHYTHPKTLPLQHGMFGHAAGGGLGWVEDVFLLSAPVSPVGVVLDAPCTAQDDAEALLRPQVGSEVRYTASGAKRPDPELWWITQLFLVTSPTTAYAARVEPWEISCSLMRIVEVGADRPTCHTWQCSAEKVSVPVASAIAAPRRELRYPIPHPLPESVFGSSPGPAPRPFVSCMAKGVVCTYPPSYPYFGERRSKVGRGRP